MSTQQNVDQIQNWLDFSLGYISAACACADSYLNQKQVASGIESYNRFAFIPAFWNFKHALEVGVKFLLPFSKRPWGHDLAKNLQVYKKERKMSDEECNDLTAMCDKYGNLRPLRKLKDVKGKNFQSFSDYKNQFFHYPEGNETHKTIYTSNRHFVYYSLNISNPDDNKTIMCDLMEELKKDALTFAKILAKHAN